MINERWHEAWRRLRKLTLYGVLLSLKATGKGLNIYSVTPEQICWRSPPPGQSALSPESQWIWKICNIWMALQQQPNKEMVDQLSLDHPQVADSSFSQKSNLALSILSPRNLGQASSVVNDKGVYCHSPPWTNPEISHSEITFHQCLNQHFMT